MNIKYITLSSNLYSTGEIIFWYIAFLVSLVVFIIFIKFGGSNKKIIKNNKVKVEKILTSINSKIENNKPFLVKENYSLVHILKKLENNLETLNASSRIAEIDKVIDHIKQILKMLKLYSNLDDKLAINGLIKIRDELLKIVDELNSILLLIKI
ncbi:MAG: hypothetical protein ACI31I_04780 [Bacilli bacterium]